MKILFFNVSHGFCAYLQADNNNVMLFDCGHNENNGFRPSNFLKSTGCNGIERLYILNYDQDHISDLTNIRNLGHIIPIHELYRNKSLDATNLHNLKLEAGPLTIAAESLISMIEIYTEPVTNPLPFPGIEIKTFHNNYPEFSDTNNLSLVVFLKYGENCLLFPGDLEKEGWSKLLELENFQRSLSDVNIFVAPHHGRESGYNEDIFKYASPDVFIISDKEITHETQKQLWGQHASGILWNGGPQKRYVLTTRSDGNILLDMTKEQGYHITTGFQI